MSRISREMELQKDFQRDVARMSRLIERLTHWEIRNMEAMDKLSAAFDRHEAELAEVKEGLKKVVEIIKEVPADTSEIEAKISAFADRLDGSTADMDKALKDSGKEKEVEVVVEPAPTEEVQPVVEFVGDPVTEEDLDAVEEEVKAEVDGENA
jgi:chromosome segregation ATPase